MRRCLPFLSRSHCAETAARAQRAAQCLGCVEYIRTTRSHFRRQRRHTLLGKRFRYSTRRFVHGNTHAFPCESHPDIFRSAVHLVAPAWLAPALGVAAGSYGYLAERRGSAFGKTSKWSVNALRQNGCCTTPGPYTSDPDAAKLFPEAYSAAAELYSLSMRLTCPASGIALCRGASRRMSRSSGEV